MRKSTKENYRIFVSLLIVSDKDRTLFCISRSPVRLNLMSLFTETADEKSWFFYIALFNAILRYA